MQTTRFQELFSIFPGESPGSLTIRNHMFRATEGARAINDGSEGAASGFVRSYYEAFDSGSGEARGRALAGIYVRVVCFECNCFFASWVSTWVEPGTGLSCSVRLSGAPVFKFYFLFLCVFLGAGQREDSFLLFEGDDVYSGAEHIVRKLGSLPATAHNIETLDVQPIADSALLVLVTGHIRIEGQENALPFNQSFQMVGGGSDFYLSNDIFAFNYS